MPIARPYAPAAMDLYVALKLVHVLAGITALGANLTYGVWLSRAAREPSHLGYTLAGISFLDTRVANPAYGLVLVTGLAMVFVHGIPLTTFWIAAALVLFVAVVVIGMAVYLPIVRAQRAALDRGGPMDPAYLGATRRSTALGVLTTVVVVAIVVLMVVKPAP